MSFAGEMIKTKEELEKLGHEVIIQEDVHLHASGEIKDEDKWRKMKIDPLKNYYKEIKKSDAIIVLNHPRKEITGYIGGNTLIEMAFAYVLDKKIFLLYDVPDIGYSDEIHSMKPIILNGDLTNIR